MTSQRGDYEEIANLIKSTLEPLTVKVTSVEKSVERLETKVDHLSQDRVTRSDMDKVKSELVATLVPRDSYEARHAALIQRDTEMETRFKKHEEDAQSIIQKLYDKFELSNHNIETQLKEHKKETEEKLKESQSVHLNNKERGWLRFSQISGALAIIIAIIGILLDHVRFQ